MSFTFPVIAEVSDKMLSWPALIIWVIVLVGLTWVLGRRKKWLLLIPLPVAWLFASGPFDEMRDPNFGPAVVAELAQSVSLGYYRGILNALADIERHHAEHAAFVQRMRALAQQFQFDAMGQILEQATP